MIQSDVMRRETGWTAVLQQRDSAERESGCCQKVDLFQTFIKQILKIWLSSHCYFSLSNDKIADYLISAVQTCSKCIRGSLARRNEVRWQKTITSCKSQAKQSALLLWTVIFCIIMYRPGIYPKFQRRSSRSRGLGKFIIKLNFPVKATKIKRTF